VLWEIPLLVIGLAAFALGARWLVDGAVQIAVYLGVRTFVVGLTIVAFGTSAPEFSMSVISSLGGENSFVLPNVIGSSIANITYVLAVFAIIAPLSIALSIERREAWFMAAAVILLVLLALDSTISFADGLVMLVVLLFYLVLLVRALIVCSPDSNICTEFDEGIPLSIGDVRGRHKIGQTDYGRAWSGDEIISIGSAPCAECVDCPAELVCPTSAIVRGNDEVVIDRARCVNCGACVAACEKGCFNGELGKVSAELNGTMRTVPIVCRGSNREGAVRTMEDLKKRVIDGRFTMTARVADLRP
jgi:ferredoxin